jgi:hypothetical protein
LILATQAANMMMRTALAPTLLRRSCRTTERHAKLHHPVKSYQHVVCDSHDCTLLTAQVEFSEGVYFSSRVSYTKLT